MDGRGHERQDLDWGDRGLPSALPPNVRSMASWSTRSPASSALSDPFTLLPRRCFCMILRPDATGHSMPCPVRVTVQGRYTDGNGMAWNVYSCEGHAHALRDERPITGSERVGS